MKIETWGKTLAKAPLGLFIGSINAVSVLFGLYSVKSVNIPIFLTFRRACLLFTVLIGFFVF